MTTNIEVIGERAGARTQDLQIKSPLLYQLSYALAPVCRAGPWAAVMALSEATPAIGAGRYGVNRSPCRRHLPVGAR